MLLHSLSSSALIAQSDEYVTNSNLRGVVPLATYQIDEIDNINLGNGAVNLSIGLFSREGRGPGYSQTVFYSSKIWRAEPIGDPLGGPLPIGHRWRPSFGQEAKLGGVRGDLVYREQFYQCQDAEGFFLASVRSNFIYTSPAGGTHRFPNRDYIVGPADELRVCGTLSDTSDHPKGTSDSGVMELDTSQTDAYLIRFKNGGQESFISGSRRVTDSNGNFNDIPGGDTLGRDYPFDIAAGTLTVKDSAGTDRVYQLDYGFLTVSTTFPTASCGVEYDISQWTQSVKVLNRLTLPNGLAYDFTYDPQFGELTRIDLPTGGYIRYVYATLAAFDNNPAFAPCRLDSRRIQERRVSEDGVNEDVWTYAYSLDPSTREYTTTVTDPLGNRAVHLFNRDGVHELEREVRDGLTTPLRRFVNTWDADTAPVQIGQDGSPDFDSKNWRIEATETTLLDSNQVSRFETDFDSYTNVTAAGTFTESRMNALEQREFGYGLGAPGPLIRTTRTTWLHDTSTLHRDRHIWDRPATQTVLGAEGEAAKSEFRYDTRPLEATVDIVQHDYASHPASMLTRGNLTTERLWLNTEDRWIETLHWYDDLGNRIRTREPLASGGFKNTHFGYDDDFEPGAPCLSGPTRAFVTSTTNALGHVASRSHLSCTSLTSSVTDANGNTIHFSYDFLDRLKQVDAPDGGQHVRYYSDTDLGAFHEGIRVFRDGGTVLPLRAKRFTSIEPGLWSSTLRILDGLGRIEFTAQRNGGGFFERWDYTQTGYDSAGNRSRSSNPFSISSSTTDLPSSDLPNQTVTAFDGLGRAVSVTTPDGETSAVSYLGDSRTLTDPAGASRRIRQDALGRVIQVREPDPATGSLDSGDFSDTFYVYDLLDDLTLVSQGPGQDADGQGTGGEIQERGFLYDSLGRLIEESHPESFTTLYRYDDRGNLDERQDARDRIVSHNYDVLDRLTGTQYVTVDPARSDPTPPVSYVWDGSTSLNRRGRLSSITDGAGSSSFEYDVMGRISRSVRTTLGTTLTADYLYTDLGGIKQATFNEVNPANYTLVYGYDDQGRQTTLHDGGGTAFVTGHNMIFDGFGASENTFYANSIVESTIFNNRLQPVFLTADRFTNVLMDLEYDYTFFGANNGNIRLITDHLDSSRDRVYLYDALNRLEGVGGVPWGIDYAYDRFGNRLSAQGTASTPNFVDSSLTYEPGTNRVQGWDYDSAGNLLDDGLRHYWRDGEGRITGVGPSMPSSPPPPGPGNGRSTLSPRTGPPSTTYLYDYDGRRAAKLDGSGGGRIYFWDEVIGEVIWEFPVGSPQQDVVRGWFNGRLVMENDTRPGGGLRYFIRDHLGSTQVTADFFTGSLICSSFFHPFGQSADSTGCDAHVRKFTQKERDPETGLDYFGARFCDSTAGRFLSPDPLLDSAEVSDPQSWNRYSFTGNNPVVYVDPNGESRIKAIRRLADLVPGRISKEFKKFLRKSRSDQAKEIRTLERTLQRHIDSRSNLFDRGIRSPETERIALELALRKRVFEKGLRASVDDILSVFDKGANFFLGVTVTEVAQIGDRVDGALGGGFAGGAAAFVIDVLNPVGLVEDAQFLASLGDSLLTSLVEAGFTLDPEQAGEIESVGVLRGRKSDLAGI